MLDITHAPADTDVDRLNGQIAAWLNRYLGGSVASFDLAGAINAGMQIMHSNRLNFPADLALLCRVLVRLQGLGGAVGATVSLTELLQPYIEQMMRERVNPAALARHAVRTLRSWNRLVSGAPAALRPLMQQLKDGEVAVDFKVHDADGITDRLIDGVLAAASILAAAQLISRRTGPRIGDISLPGAIALAAGALTWRRLLVQRPGHRSSLSRLRQLARPSPT